MPLLFKYPKKCEWFRHKFGEVLHWVHKSLGPFLLPTIVVHKADPDMCLGRHYAAAICDASAVDVMICPRLLEQSDERIVGVILHELGHVLHDYRLDIARAIKLNLGFLEGADDEQAADLMIKHVCGIKISYDDDFVQYVDLEHGTTGKIDFRPLGLK